MKAIPILFLGMILLAACGPAGQAPASPPPLPTLVFTLPGDATETPALPPSPTIPWTASPTRPTHTPLVRTPPTATSSPVPPTPTTLPKLYATRTDQRIAFVSERSGQVDIYTMNPDGSDVVQVTNDELEDYYPSWSPDGKRLAYVCYTTEGGPQSEYTIQRAKIFTINIDGRGRHVLLDMTGSELYPSWAPDGRRIAYSAHDLYVVDVNGGPPTQLVFASLTVKLHQPAWSPDGRRLVFTSEGRTGTNTIQLVTLGMPGWQSLAAGWDPAWSPDGTRILFVASAGDNYQLFVIDATGENLRQLTSDPTDHYNPDWSPDGTRIVYSNGSSHDSEIYVMDADGSNPVNVTNHPGLDSFPVWRK